MLDLTRLRGMAGCTRLCALSAAERPEAPIIRVQHNGVAFSRRADIDRYVVVTLTDAIMETLAAWFAAHHRGDTSAPFCYELAPGRTVLVMEAVD